MRCWGSLSIGWTQEVHMPTVNICNWSVDVNGPSSFKVKKRQQTLLCFLLKPSGFPVNNILSLSPPSHKVPWGNRKLTAAHHSLLQPATWSPLILKFFSSHPLLVIHSLLFFNTNTQMGYYNDDLHSCFCCSLTQFSWFYKMCLRGILKLQWFQRICIYLFFSSKELKDIWWSDSHSWERLPRLPWWW